MINTITGLSALFHMKKYNHEERKEGDTIVCLQCSREFKVLKDRRLGLESCRCTTEKWMVKQDENVLPRE